MLQLTLWSRMVALLETPTCKQAPASRLATTFTPSHVTKQHGGHSTALKVVRVVYKAICRVEV